MVALAKTLNYSFNLLTQLQQNLLGDRKEHRVFYAPIQDAHIHDAHIPDAHISMMHVAMMYVSMMDSKSIYQFVFSIPYSTSQLDKYKLML